MLRLLKHDRYFLRIKGFFENVALTDLIVEYINSTSHKNFVGKTKSSLNLKILFMLKQS
jgi:hypothetical protein